MNEPHRVIVIGGGSAGMVAAIAAARAGATVTVLERMARVGKKLLATGNGRCNLTNAHLGPERFHGGNAAFVASALDRFGLEATLAFFRGLGIEPREEGAGKIFPRSGQASSVLDVLRHETARLGVETRCETDVVRLHSRGRAWEVVTPGETHACDAMVLATGGKASPQLGSNGSGYALARALGHRVVEPFPALTRIRVRSPFLKHLKGVKVEGLARLLDGPSASGEILFTETGLSGPPILDLSRSAAERSRRREPAEIRLDVCPEIAAHELAALLRARFGGRSGVTAEFALVGFIHKRLIAAVLKAAGIADPAAPAAAVDEPALRALAGVLKAWRFEVTGTDSWTEAQVTAGGIDTSEIDPVTLQSRKAPGLYLAGEVLDVDGDCGGYNLQWAWSSGFVAGEAAARRR
jgi:predicted Rossmann fold flavoprotein